MVKKQLFFDVLKNHWSFVIGILGGMGCGLWYKDLAIKLQPFAQLYINLLQLSVIPVIVITVTTGISHMMTHHHAKNNARRIFLVLGGLLLFSSVVSTIIGAVLTPGEGLSSKPEISSLIASNKDVNSSFFVDLDDEIVVSQSASFIKFLLTAVPNNIFQSLSQGAILQIIIFSIIFGAAIGYRHNQDGHNRSEFLSNFLPVFTLINEAVLLFLPIGIFFLLASQFAAFEFSIILVLSKLILAICLSMITLICVFIGLIWHYSNRPFKEVMKALSQLTLVAISTRSAFACIPKCIDGMSRFFDKDMVNLVIPFGNTTCKYGSICFYTIGTIFISNMFLEPLTFYSYAMIVLGALLASVASSGAIGILSLQMITIVLDPLGLPLGSILALFIAIDPIIDVFDTLANVYGNCAATAMTGRTVETPLKNI